MNGYASRQYADSLTQIGRPRWLPLSECWVLERAIPGSVFREIMGCYPFVSCRNGEFLTIDLENLGKECVCFSAVLDPLGGFDPQALAVWFPDHAIAFKEHFVVDLVQWRQTSICAHHRRNARRALRSVTVEYLSTPHEYAETWCQLYANLVRRHSIRGFAAFNKTALTKQLHVPGAIAFRAVFNGATVGMVIWYVAGDVGYYHLGAYTDLGYESRAAFALFSVSIDHLASSGLRWLNLGGRAGIVSDQDDGLSRFKRGWATGTRTAYFCGKILDRDKYADLVNRAKVPDTAYFPAYRAGE